MRAGSKASPPQSRTDGTEAQSRKEMHGLFRRRNYQGKLHDGTGRNPSRRSDEILESRMRVVRNGKLIRAGMKSSQLAGTSLRSMPTTTIVDVPIRHLDHLCSTSE